VRPAETRDGAAIYFFQKACPANPSTTDQAIPALIAGLIPVLSSFLINTTDKLIAAYRQGLTGSFSAGATAPGIYDDNGQLNFTCLVIARGAFGKTTKLGAGGDEYVDNVLVSQLGMAAYPYFYFEAEASLRGTSLILTPRYIRYEKTSARRAGKGKKKVAIALALSEEVLDRNAALPANDKLIALYRFDLGELEIGKSYAHTKEAPLLAGTATQQVVPAFGADKMRVPFNAVAVVTETEDSSLIFEALSQTFTSKKSDIEELITDAIKDAIAEEKDGE